jgi:hypothetical protein
MAAIFCSSVILAMLASEFVPRVDFTLDLFDDCSFRDEFLVFIGIFPVTYLAARPAPAFIGGSRRAIMEVDRGMIVVSSTNSTQEC